MQTIIKIIKTLTIAIISISIFYSCSEDDFTKVVDIDINAEAPRLVLLADLTEYNHIVISATESATDANIARPRNIGDAIVTITSERGDTRSLLYRDSVYVVDFLFEPGLEYTIQVDHPDYENIQATTTAPFSPDVKFESLSIGSDDSGFEQRRVITFELEIDDPHEEENYYNFTGYNSYYYANSGDTSAQDIYLYFVDDSLTEEDWLSDLSFNGRTKQIRLRESQYVDREQTYLEYIIFIQSLPKEKIEYERSIRLLEESEDNPFVEPTVIYTNVTGGYGIFAIPGQSIIRGSYE